MKNIFRYFTILLVAVASLCSCKQDVYLYTPTNECVTFDRSSSNYMTTDEPDITLTLTRGVLDNPLTVNLDITGSSVFSLSATSVSFAAGEYSKEVKVLYDMDAIEAGESYECNVSFDKKMVSPSGYSNFNCVITSPGGFSEYEDYATVVFYQSCMNSSVTLHAEEYSVLQVSKYDKKKYRVRNAINSGLDLEFTLDFDGTLNFLNETTSCPYDGGDYIKVPSTIEYDGEYVTFWIDPNPRYCGIDAYPGTGEYPMDLTTEGGTSVYWYVWMETPSKGILTFTDGDDGWWKMYYDVCDLSPITNDDDQYTRLGKVEFYQSRLNASVTSDKVWHSNLLVNNYDPAKYRIKNVYGSDFDLDFTLSSDGTLALLNPTTTCPYDNGEYIKIPTAIEYEGEKVTIWIDPSPKYLYVDNLNDGTYTMGITSEGGTSIYWYVWMETDSKGILTFTDGDDGWWKQYYDVTEIYL